MKASTTTERILAVGRLMPALEQRLAAAFDVTSLAAQADPTDFLARQGADFSGLVTSAALGVDNAVIDALPNLKVISSFGVGLDRLDVRHAAARGVAVGYTPDVLNDCVADLAFGLMIDAARQISAADRYVRRGGWLQAPYPLTRKVSGARLGIVGLGRIGRVVAQRAAGFGMPIRYHSRRAVAGVAWQHEPDLLALADWADFLVVIVAGGPATRHLIDARVLQALGPQGYLVNVARGSVVDEAALLHALQTGVIAGAGLDVYQDEPQVPPAFFTLDNVVLAPHMASATRETRQAMADLTFENLAAFYATGRVKVSAV
ncbi:2-hydroxyacid dehydrogenase [Verticiella sediminum]|uniref:2-hydroxyacid dehydrogenase n=1 Tax=Verticiella sediminum TaxID=1247510 RepID=A0A556AMT6_9BURK|nr:2-hydroxyacid dehydrogenase [Verticiella sediminum]TSH94203.1 2-hydroxyacid dehydrogenase [Verticiella sediminum]